MGGGGRGQSGKDGMKEKWRDDAATPLMKMNNGHNLSQRGWDGRGARRRRWGGTDGWPR